MPTPPRRGTKFPSNGGELGAIPSRGKLPFTMDGGADSRPVAV